MASGKSSVGKKLATLLGFEYIDLDKYIEHKIGLPIRQIIDRQKESGFRAIEAEALRDVIIMHKLTEKDLVLSLGGGTLSISGIQYILLEDTTLVYLKASEKELKHRLDLDKDTERPLLNTDFEELLKKRECDYKLAHITIDTDNKSIEQVAHTIYDIVKKECRR